MTASSEFIKPSSSKYETVGTTIIPATIIQATNVEARELRSRFSVLAAIGIQYSITGTPLAIGSYLAFILGAGGSPFFFYAFLVASVGQLLVCTSLSEIASVYPHASGRCFSQSAGARWLLM